MLGMLITLQLRHPCYNSIIVHIGIIMNKIHIIRSMLSRALGRLIPTIVTKNSDEFLFSRNYYQYVFALQDIHLVGKKKQNISPIITIWLNKQKSTSDFDYYEIGIQDGKYLIAFKYIHNLLMFKLSWYNKIPE